MEPPRPKTPIAEPGEVFPLERLFAELREAGMHLGIDRYLDAGRLLARWDGTSLAELTTALCAVLASDAADVAVIRRVIQDLRATPTPVPGPTPPPPTAPSVRRAVRSRLVVTIVAGVAVVAMMALATAIAALDQRLDGRRRVTVYHYEVANPPPPPTVVPSNPENDCAAWPAPPQNSEPRFLYPLGPTALLAALLALILLWATRIRRVSLHQAREAWQRRSDALSGPQDYRVPRFARPPAFADELLDDLAAHLTGSGIERDDPEEVDVTGSLIATLEAGMVPTVVHALRRRAVPLLFLEDVSFTMQAWREKLVALRQGLVTRGVWVEAWTFEADPRVVTPRDGALGQPLAGVLQSKPGARMLIVSSGAGVQLLADEGDLSWRGALASTGSAAWVSPEPSRHLWCDELHHLPLPVFGMDAQGLERAFATLARPHVRPEATRCLAAEARVTERDVEKLRWVSTFLPQRDAAWLDVLRRRTCPEVPESAVRLALDAGPSQIAPIGGPDGTTILQALSGLLDACDAPEGSPAAARLGLDRAVAAFRLNPGGATRDRLACDAWSGLPGEALDHLRLLARTGSTPPGLVSKETMRVARREADRLEQRGRLEVLGHTSLRQALSRRDRWLLPTPSEAALALLVGGLATALAAWAGYMRVPTLPNVRGYDLRCDPASTTDDAVARGDTTCTVVRRVPNLTAPLEMAQMVPGTARLGPESRHPPDPPQTKEVVSSFPIEDIPDEGGCYRVQSSMLGHRTAYSNSAYIRGRHGGDKETIRKYIRSHVAPIRECYEQGLRKLSGLEGKVVVSFLVSPTGKVVQSTVKETTLHDAVVEQCVLDKVNRWSFAAPSDGNSISVTYPFVFAQPPPVAALEPDCSRAVVYFDHDERTPNSDGVRVLAELAECLQRPELAVGRVTVAAHNDARGSDEYNVALAKGMGASVQRILEKAGVGRGRVTTVSYGEERPVCNQSTESCWARNRRVEITVEVPEQRAPLPPGPTEAAGGPSADGQGSDPKITPEPLVDRDPILPKCSGPDFDSKSRALIVRIIKQCNIPISSGNKQSIKFVIDTHGNIIKNTIASDNPFLDKTGCARRLLASYRFDERPEACNARLLLVLTTAN